ncbi:hypothetical protein T484DRAFT_1838058, partial [Baffinella frigidus]
MHTDTRPSSWLQSTRQPGQSGQPGQWGCVTDTDLDAGATALHHAAGNGDLNTVALLTSMGAHINAPSQLGTPL